MKIRLMSDLHFECRNGQEFLNSLEDVECDVVVIAGDLSNYRKLEESMNMVAARFNPIPVVVVNGNHDFWGATQLDVIKTMERVVDSNYNLHWLDNSIVELKGKRFLGGTLWYSRVKPEQEAYWSDFHYIKDLRHWVYRKNVESFDFLRFNIGLGDVVVTHMLPSYRCVAPQYQNEETNCFFVSPMDDIIKKNMPALWLFGHTHVATHVELKHTDLWCNPKGYPSEKGGFDPGLVLTLD